MGAWLVAALSGCHGSEADLHERPDVTVPEPPHTEALGPDLVLVLDALVEPVGIPCEEVRVVRIENRSADNVTVDALTVTPADEATFGLNELLQVPRLVRPDDAIEIPMRARADTPTTGLATVTLTSEGETYEAELSVPIAWAEERTEAFVTPLPATDIVFAVDHSAAMAADHHEALERAVPRWLDALDAVADWRLILVTEDEGCANGGIFEAGDPDAADHVAHHAFDDLGGDERTEALLELSAVALSQNADTECNGAFQRRGAQLHVVTLSDEREQSGRAWQTWVTDFHGYADEVRVSAIAALGACGDADGYEDAARATDGVLLDLCDRGWGDDGARLADAVDLLPPHFALQAEAWPPSIVAEVDGAEVEASYVEDDNAAVVPSAAEPGTAVTVRYAVPATCAAATP
ncbi:MAG: hypothetical protein R3F59_01450 [Myxococcota bacterium]